MIDPAAQARPRLPPEYENARGRYDGLGMQLDDLRSVVEDLHGSLHEAIDQQARLQALGADQRSAGIDAAVEERTRSLTDDVNRSEEIIAKVTIDWRAAHETERRVYWRDTIAYQGGLADPEPRVEIDGAVRYESTTGVHDVLDGLAVQAEITPVTGHQGLPTRQAPPITSTQGRAQMLRAQQQRHQPPRRGFGR